MITISITYEKTTPESAEQGDVSDRGFWEVGGWEFSLNNDKVVFDLHKHPELYVVPWEPGDLRAAIEIAQGTLGIYQPSCVPCTGDNGEWWSSEAHTDPATCEDTNYSLHIDGVTPSTRRRIHRALNGQPLFGE